MKKVFRTKMSYKAWGIVFLFFSSILVTLAISGFMRGHTNDALIMTGIGFAGLAYGLNHFMTKVKVEHGKIMYTTWYVPRALDANNVSRIVEASKMPRLYGSIRERRVAYAEARAGGTPMTGTTYFLDIYGEQRNISIKDIRHFEDYEELYSILENITGKKVERGVQQWREQSNAPGRF